MQYHACRMRVAELLVLAALCTPLSLNAQVQFTKPQPGDVYKEYTYVMVGEEWRVTDPNINLSLYPQAAPFLPNPSLPLTLDDLQGATRAEAVVSLWGGHVGTTGKRIRFNGNAWIPIPELAQANGIPAGSDGQCYLTQSMVTVSVPLSDLVQGANSFQGENAGQTCYGFQWGQHGWYGIALRVYYNPATTPHTTGAINTVSTGGVLGENPLIGVALNGSADRVDFLAWYDGYDSDGDGIYAEYHEDYHFGAGDVQMAPRNHVGTATGAPFQATWNTTWIPDQPAGGIKLLARIRGTNGFWYVTEEVKDLSLVRSGRSVALYKPVSIGERAWARGDLAVVDVPVSIPGSANLSDATAAVYHNRTWNGLDAAREPGETHYRRYNGWDDGDYGRDHAFSYDLRPIPTGALAAGTTFFSFYSQTVAHHGIEILYPGPGLSVEYTGAYASPVPLTPTLASPANAAGNQPASVTLRWHRTIAAASYHLQVAKDLAFAQMVVNDSTITDTSKLVGPLENTTTYYWRVQAKNAAGSSASSQTWSFSTFVAAPSLLSPPNTATSQPTTLTLSWHPLPAATGYQLQIATDTTFGGGGLVKDTTTVDTTAAVGGLANDVHYVWRVRAMSGATPGSYSPAWSFRTIVAAAAIPQLVVPADAGTGLPTSLTLGWRSAAGASTYHVQLSTDAGFSGTLLLNDSLLVDTLRVAAGLAYDTQYFWRVAAAGPGGKSGFSAPRSFTTTQAAPNAPVLVAPIQGATGQTTNGLRFTWQTIVGAMAYRFQLGTDSTFAGGLVKNDSSLVDTSRVISGLQLSTRYHWRVAAKTAGGWSAPSPTWSLTTLVPLPGGVTLLAPAALSQVNRDSARFSWAAPTPPATRYWFEIGVDSLFTSFRSVDSMLTDTAKVFRPLLNNTRYYWRVRGGNTGGWGTFSEVRSFQVLITGVADRTTPIPSDWALGQNYPNPFNPSTRIAFALPAAGRVRIEIYNLLGERVALLLDEERPAGEHAISFDARSLPSGTYLYRMTTEGRSLSRRMLLVR